MKAYLTLAVIAIKISDTNNLADLFVSEILHHHPQTFINAEPVPAELHSPCSHSHMHMHCVHAAL